MSKSKKGMSANAKWGIAFLIEVIMIVLLVVAYVSIYVGDKLEKVQILDIKKEDLAINEGANEAQKGYTTIALFGIDARSTTSMAEGNRSDSIIIASINNDTKEVKLVSVYRDTLLELADGSGLTTKITHAYAYGGPELAIKTLNANLDLEITDFVTVNFLALTQAIDDLGGLVIDVHDNELPILNLAITEQIEVTGIPSDGVFTSGEQLLNGTQATAYARIRSTDQGDITRTERQRDVLAKMIAKAKKSDLQTINNIIDHVFPNVYTSISKKELLDLAKNLVNYELGDTIGFPMTPVVTSSPNKGSIIAPADLITNVSALHEFLFGTENYTPTSGVQRISGVITSETGVGAQQVDIKPYVAQ